MMPGLPAAAATFARRALAHETSHNEPANLEARVRLRMYLAVALRETIDPAAAKAFLTDAVALLDGLSRHQEHRQTARLRSEIALEQGWTAMFRGDGNEARRKLQDAVGLAQAASDGHLEGRARSALGAVLAEVFADENAFDHHEESVRLLSETGDEEAVSTAKNMRAIHELFFRRGARDEAFRAHAERRSATRPSQRAYAVFHLGLYALDRDQFALAESYFVEAKKLAFQSGHRRLPMGVETALGVTLDRQDTELQRVRAHYEAALEHSRVIEDPRYHAMLEYLLAGVAARDGDARVATELFRSGDERLERTGDVRFSSLGELLRGHLDLMHAKRAAVQGSASAVRKYLERAEARMRSARHEPLISKPPGPTLVDCCAEARHCLPILGRGVKQLRTRLQTLFVAQDGSWIQRGAEPHSPIPNGPVIRRFLLELVEHRLSAPGEPLSAHDLIDRCWPNERIQAAAGIRRVQNLIRRLRQHGLGEVLLNGLDGGYLLDPETIAALTPATRTGGSPHA